MCHWRWLHRCRNLLSREFHDIGLARGRVNDCELNRGADWPAHHVHALFQRLADNVSAVNFLNNQSRMQSSLCRRCVWQDAHNFKRVAITHDLNTNARKGLLPNPALRVRGLVRARLRSRDGLLLNADPRAGGHEKHARQNDGNQSD